MQKSFWLILLVVLGSMVVLFMATGSSNTDSTTYDPSVIQITDHIDGITIPSTQAELDKIISDKKAVLIEYADFQCPACRAFSPVLEKLQTDYQEELVTVFRHFPLTSIHPNSMATHRAAEAAANQSKFWEMHDLLYLRQNEWSSSSNIKSVLESYAEELNLNVTKFRQDVESSQVFDRINLDILSARPWNVNSTPTIFFNGVRVDNPSLDTMTGLIDSALDS